MQMKTILLLLENTITAIMSYGMEGCFLRKKDYTSLNAIFCGALKQAFSLATSTPNAIVYKELGIPKIEYIIKMRKTTFFKQITERKQSLCSQCLENCRKWLVEHQSIMEELGVTEADLQKPMANVKQFIKKRIAVLMDTWFNEEASKKKKVRNYLDMENKLKQQNEGIETGHNQYIKNLDRYRAKLILQVKSKMFPVEGNWKFL